MKQKKKKLIGFTNTKSYSISTLKSLKMFHDEPSYFESVEFRFIINITKHSLLKKLRPTLNIIKKWMYTSIEYLVLSIKLLIK